MHSHEGTEVYQSRMLKYYALSCINYCHTASKTIMEDPLKPQKATRPDEINPFCTSYLNSERSH
jgi:hypothetical protein